MSTPAVTFSGLASGFDASSIISELVTADKAPETDLQGYISDAQTQISTLGGIISNVQALGAAADALNTSTSITSLTATSSDTSQVNVSADGTAVPGNYSVVVNALAQAQGSVSTQFGSDTAGVAGTGSITVTAGNGTPYTVSYGSSDTLDSIAANLTQESNGALNASVLFDGTGYRIVVNATNSGAANAITFSGSGGALGLSAAGATLEAAQDASVTINGLTVTRPTNSISDVVQGVTFNLLSKTPAGGTPPSVGVQYDDSSLATKMQTIVSAYNAVVSSLGSQLNYNGSTMPTSSLFGDSGLQQLQGDLSNIIVQSYANGSGSLTSADLGITLNNDGTLSLDSTKFASAVAANPQAVQNLLLGTGSNGMVAAIDSLVTNYTQSGTGVLSTETSSRNDLITGYNNQIDQIEAQAATLQDQLTTEFANLDTIESTYKSQASYLTQLSNSSSSSSG